MARIKSQGTKHYVAQKDDTVTNVLCYQNLSMGEDTPTKEDAQCLDDLEPRQRKTGVEPGDTTYDIIYDDENPSHLKLFQLSDSEEDVDFIWCARDCTTAPTSASGVITFPTTGHSWHCKGQVHISTPALEAKKDVKYTVTLIRTPIKRIIKQ